jgi:DNA mismatch endonuclease (patch repair protein)
MDNLTPVQRRKNMQSIRSTGTVPEKAVFRELRKRKVYFAKHVKTLPGKPDVVFRRKKVVVFIDSDFWHGHPSKFIKPMTNEDYWTNKISSNKKRDRKVTRELRKQGWKVLRIWESDIKSNVHKCVDRIIRVLESA